MKKPSAIIFTRSITGEVPAWRRSTPPRSRSSTLPIAPPRKFVSFVGADDYSLGLETARHLLKTLGGKGNIVIIEASKGSLTNVDRVKLQRRAERNSVRQTVGVPASQLSALQALQVMKTYASNSQIDVVLAANDAWRSRLEALDGSTASPGVGINGTKEAVDAIKSGKLLAQRRLQRLFSRGVSGPYGDPVAA